MATLEIVKQLLLVEGEWLQHDVEDGAELLILWLLVSCQHRHGQDSFHLYDFFDALLLTEEDHTFGVHVFQHFSERERMTKIYSFFHNVWNVSQADFVLGVLAVGL